MKKGGLVEILGARGLCGTITSPSRLKRRLLPVQSILLLLRHISFKCFFQRCKKNVKNLSKSFRKLTLLNSTIKKYQNLKFLLVIIWLESIVICLYNKTRHSYISIAGQTAGPIRLKFFVDTQGWPGGDIGKKFPKIFFFLI